jgi:hypothetical protein
MAAKLTFEAKMNGMEQVLDLLKRAEERMNDFGRVGDYALHGVDSRLKEFQQSLETLNKTGGGINGLFNRFDELNRRSNEFLGKSYRGIIDAMKQEVKNFELESDKILNKIKESENALESFKSRRKTMNEQDYQEGISNHQRELNSLRAQGTAIASEKAQLQRELFIKQPISEGAHAFASKYGLGQYATVGGAIMAGAAVAGLPYAAGQVMSVAGRLGMQELYTKEADAWIAQQRLKRGAAQEAMAGDPTTLMVNKFGGGLENAANDSIWNRMSVTGQYLVQNPYARFGAGAAALAASVLGAIPSGGLSLLAAGGGIGMMASSFTAANKPYAQIRAEEQAALRARDKEAYGVVFGNAAQMQLRENAELGDLQRINTIHGAHNISLNYAANGVSMDRANPIINMMIAQGLNPTRRDMRDQAMFANAMFRSGYDDTTRQQMIRVSALSGSSLTAVNNQMTGVLAGAGLHATDVAANRSLAGYVSGLMANSGASQDFGSVGASVSGAISANAPGFNKVEGVQQGITATQTVDNLMNGGSSAMSAMTISKLRELGVTNAFAIDTFMKMGLGNRKTHDAIARYVGGGMTASKVREALRGVIGTYSNMVKDTIGGDELKKLNAATKGDVTTLYTENKKAFENTQAGGATFQQASEGMFKEGAGTGDTSMKGFNMLADSGGDKTNKAQADLQRQIDAAVKEAIAGTGKEVTSAIMDSIVDGFTRTATAVREAGERYNKSAADNKGSSPTAPVTGTKNRMPRGQQG